MQERRDNKRIPNHGELHDYANLYFDARNPMMFFLTKNKNIDELCVICVDKKVLDLEDTIVTDQNAARNLALFASPDEGIKFINFDKVKAVYWNEGNYNDCQNNKAIKCAKVLVLNKVPIEYLIKIKVCTELAKQKVKKLNLGVPVKIDRNMFFK